MLSGPEGEIINPEHMKIETQKDVRILDRPVITEEQALELWRKVGYESFQALGERLFVRVSSPPDQTAGGLWYPMKSSAGTGLYDDRLGSKVFILGDVISVGARVPGKFKIGDQVLFSRINFAWVKRILRDIEDPDSGDYLGFIDPRMIEGKMVHVEDN